MNPYANFGPLLTYSSRTHKSAIGQGSTRVGPPYQDPGSGGNPHNNGSPLKNLVLCIARRSTGSFVTTVRKILSDKASMYTAVMDGLTHQSVMITEFNKFAYNSFVNQGEPANTAIVIEDPALLDESVRNGLILAYLRTSIAGKNLVEIKGRPPIIHVFLGNVAGFPSASKAIKTCGDLEQSLIETLPCPGLHIILNSLLQPDGFNYSGPIQEHISMYFDRTKMNPNDFALDEREVVESLRGKLAFLQDLKNMLTASRLSLILGDLGIMETTYSRIQDKVLRGEALKDPEALKDVVVLEQKIKMLLSELDIPPPPPA